RAWTGDFDFERAHAVLLRLLGGVFGGNLRRVRRRFARALETHGARRRPGNGIALHVGDGDHGVVERGVDVRHAGGDVFAFASADARSFFTHSEPFCGSAPAEPAPSHFPVWRAVLFDVLIDALFLLSGNGLGRTFSGACVGVGALAAHRQTAAMTQTAGASGIHQPLDVHRHFAPQVALDHVVAG